MLANEKMPPFKWAIVYYNRFIALAIIAGIGIYLGYDFYIVGNHEVFLTYWLMAVLAFLLKEVLYQSRGVIHSMGHSKIYFLLILFYCPFMFNAFVANEFKLTQLQYDFSIVNHEFSDFVYYKILVFSLSIAVIWYIFDIEFDKPSRKLMDIKALLIEDKKLHSWSQDIVNWSHIFSITVISCYSLPLGVLVICAVTCRMWMNDYMCKLYMLSLGVMCVLLGMHTELLVLNLAHAWWSYAILNGFWVMVSKQFHTLRDGIKFGITIIAAPYFLMCALAEIRVTKGAKKKIEKYIKEDALEDNTDGQIQFGTYAETGKDVNLTEGEFNYHALYLGTTGGGKTTAIMNNVEHCAKEGIPLIMLDGKGSPDLPERMKELADRYGRKFKVFTLKPNALRAKYPDCLAAYHPFSTGTFTEWKNRIMSLFVEAEGRGQQHFAIGEEKTLNLILGMLSKIDVKNVDLKKLYQITSNPNAIRELARATGDARSIAAVENITTDDLGDVAGVLELFIESSYGELFDTSTPNVIRLQESIINNEIVLFMFDSSAYKEDTKKIAKMVINDINSAFSTMIENTGSTKKCFCVFDEFASYASSNLSDTLTLHRTNGLHGIVGTQGLETVSLSSKENARVAEELVACCGTFLFLQLQHEKDIERVANLIGTQKSYEVTRQMDISEGQGATGMGSSKEINEYIVHPETIRKLSGRDGTGILWRKTYGQKPFKIILRRVQTGK